jgi:hypothetical protein
MALTKIKSSGVGANVLYQTIVAGTGITITANSESQIIIASNTTRAVAMTTSILFGG